MSNNVGALAAAQQEQVQRLYADVPPVVGVSGPPGIGKSVVFLRAFPRALFIAKKGALKPAIPVVGWAPLHVEEATNLKEVESKVEKILKAKNSPHDAVVLDDLGAAVEATELAMTPKFKDGRQMYKALGGEVRRLIGRFRELGCAVGLSTHYREPKGATKDSPARAGGVNLPGVLAWKVPSETDLWVHMRPDLIRNPWPASLFCDLTELGTRDRHHVCVQRNPPNVGELLRAAGYNLSRPPGCEWHEQAIEHIAGQLVPGHEAVVLQQAVNELKASSVPRWQLEWIIQDSLDRAEIRRNLQAKRSQTYAYMGITL